MKTKFLKRIGLCIVLFCACLTGFSQESFMFRAPVKSPEVTAQGITFRLRAPKARMVQVSTSWLNYDGSKAVMTQDKEGVWSVTLPLPEPELYTYTYIVDGISMLDPSNVLVQRDGSRYMNGVLIEGGDADLYKSCEKAGTLERVWYYSAENKMRRRMSVYTPYGYDPKSSKKYPVLYLLHGTGGDEEAWADLGRTCQILDNLIAQGRAVPMICVMPNGNPNEYAAQTLQIPVNQNAKKYENRFDNFDALANDIVPFMEKHYNVIANRNGRAVTGLSMGGGQAFYLAFKFVNKFAWFGSFSPGLIGIGLSFDGSKPFIAEKEMPGILTTPDKYNKFRLIFLSCGEQDNRLAGIQKFRDDLQAAGYKNVYFESCPGVHEWKVWRKHLASFAQKIFTE